MNIFSKSDDSFVFEKKWINFASNYIEDLKEISLNDKENWISNFFSQTIHFCTIILPTIIDTRFSFEQKPNKKEFKRFYQKINKISEKDFRSLVLLIVFDYFNQDRPTIREVVDKEFPNNELENLIYSYYLCSPKDIQTFKKFVLKNETYFPTFLLLENLFFDEYSKDEKIVQLCDFIKEELYNQFDLSFLKIYNKKSFLEE